jgi:hypothetical protein
MIRKSEYFEQVDKYINSELSQSELIEFEAQLALDSNLADEVNLHLDVQQAIAETDVNDLRLNLKSIIQNEYEAANDTVLASYNFNLAENNLSSNSVGQINTKNLIDFEASFPKIHLYQHKIAGKENIHQFYKEQFDSNNNYTDEFEFNPFEEQIFAEVQSAIEESDIAELRANLKQVAMSIPAHSYSSEDIENYINDLMDDQLKARFEEDLSVNVDLAHEIQLTRDIDLAVAEKDIMELRANLNKIQQSDNQNTANIEDIERYINNELSSDEMASFETVLSTSQKLQQEIDLIKDINRALGEDDVMRLRNNLQKIASQINDEKTKERSFVGKFNLRRMLASAVAASIIILLGVSGLLSKHQSADEIYQKYYAKYEITGTVRSANTNQNNSFSLALQKFENKEYTEALMLFKQVAENNPENMASHFYSGVSFQETGKYNNAIEEYNTVIQNKDNLFTEQAQWYTGLCLLQINDNKKAYKQFKKIAESKGFYQDKANEILKKIKFVE